MSEPNLPSSAEPGNSIELKWSDKAIRELEALKTHYPDLKSCILPGLWIAQRESEGNLTAQSIAEVAHRLHRSPAEVEGVATFYSMYNTGHAVGKHMIEVCTCLSCQVCGGYRILDYLKEKLGIDLGETTADGQITLHEVECLNACDRAPVIQVGDTYYGPLDLAGIDRLIDDLRGRPESSVVGLANAVVQVQLRGTEQVSE